MEDEPPEEEGLEDFLPQLSSIEEDRRGQRQPRPSLATKDTPTVLVFLPASAAGASG